MSLVRLLTLGTCLDKSRNYYGRFKSVGIEAVVPCFSVPVGSRSAKRRSKPDSPFGETETNSNPKTHASSGTADSPFDDSFAKSSEEPLPLPEAQLDNTAQSEEGGRVFLGGWFRKRLPARRASELLHQVTVTRNDLSLADLELVPVRADASSQAVSWHGKGGLDEKNLARRVFGLFRSMLPLG